MHEQEQVVLQQASHVTRRCRGAVLASHHLPQVADAPCGPYEAGSATASPGIPATASPGIPATASPGIPATAWGGDHLAVSMLDLLLNSGASS